MSHAAVSIRVAPKEPSLVVSNALESYWYLGDLEWLTKVLYISMDTGTVSLRGQIVRRILTTCVGFRTVLASLEGHPFETEWLPRG